MKRRTDAEIAARVVREESATLRRLARFELTGPPEDHVDPNTRMPWHTLSDDELYATYAYSPDPLVRELCRRLEHGGPRCGRQ